MTVTKELNALIAQYDGSARDALNHTLAQLQAANAEIRDLKHNLAQAEETAALFSDGWRPANEPPRNACSVRLLTQKHGEIIGWYSYCKEAYYRDEDVDAKRKITPRPTAWKELS